MAELFKFTRELLMCNAVSPEDEVTRCSFNDVKEQTVAEEHLPFSVRND